MSLVARHLEGRNVALRVPNSSDAVRAPLVAHGLRALGADVTAFAGPDPLRWTTPDALAWATGRAPGPDGLGRGSPTGFDAVVDPEADVDALAVRIVRETTRSPWKGLRVLVTGGPTPVPIDGVRRITNRFRGRLGALVAEELHLRGADVLYLHGDGAWRPPAYLPIRVARTYDEYRAGVGEILAERPHALGIFSAAVADYRPATRAEGKIPSGRADLSIPLVPTAKVIDEVQKRFPALPLVSFKYQERISHDELMRIAADRLARGHRAVVANRGEETGPDGEQIAWVLLPGAPAERLVGKEEIARGLVDRLAPMG